MSAFAGKADIATFFRYPCSRHYDPLVRLTPGAGLVRILSYLRLSTVLALCSLPNVVELAVNRGNLGFISSALGQPAALTKSQTDVLNSYSKTVQDFRSTSSEYELHDHFRVAHATAIGWRIIMTSRDPGTSPEGTGRG